MNITKTYSAREGELYIAYADQITFDSSTNLSGAFSSAGHSIASAIKNITVTPPETGWDKQDFIGQNTDGFQNQLLDEKPAGVATVTGTLVLAEDETIEDYLVSGSVISAPAGYTRRGVGESSQTVAACVVLGKGGSDKQASFAFDNARATKWGDVRISGPDSHWEQDFTIICLAKDFKFERKD